MVTIKRPAARRSFLVHILVMALGTGTPVPAFALARPPELAPPPACIRPTQAAAPAAVPPGQKGEASKGFVGDAFVRTELFFGTGRPKLPDVSAKDFKRFLDVVVTPCFPDGLTLLSGAGQFRESHGQIVQETSFVLVLLYPQDARQESDLRIEAIRGIYKEHFLQESVLRVDDPRAVRVGF
jgi:hypothetical protein